MITQTNSILNLLFAKGLGSIKLGRVLERAEELGIPVADVATLETAQLRKEFGLSDKLIAAIADAQDMANETAESLATAGIETLVRGIHPYPQHLAVVLGDTAPIVLFARGNLDVLKRKAVGFCGARNASDKGLGIAADAAQQLAKQDVNVVSGYAKGVDLTAHKHAMQAGGVTTIILAEGIEHYRPKSEVRDFFNADNHLVLSEFWPRAKWSGRGAMQRNRTIIGLSDAMVCIEAGTKGGTHAAAESSLELGIPLFVTKYADPPESAAGNQEFIDRGASSLGRGPSGKPNLNKVFATIGLTSGESLPDTIAPIKSDEWQPKLNSDATPITEARKSHVGCDPNSLKYPKRLIEVDLPIARISAHARREKSIRHGHISTLHIWWARRPLAACRAVICAALWPDPADELCPQAFREAAVEQIKAFANRVFPKKITEEGRQLASEKHCSAQSRARWEAIAAGTLTLDATESADMPLLRMCLLDFIADFANWDNSTVPAYLETSRALTQAAHEALGGAPGTRPLVVDPFAGGGSIPLEALRVGADAFASDLNPVAVLLNKVVLEYIPKYGQRLADEVRKWGQWVKEQAEKELAESYPKDPDGATPIAYIWARTIQCEGPSCGLTVPLIGSFWLCRKREPRYALRLQVSDKVSFDLLRNPAASEVEKGLTSGNKATCPKCGYTTPTNRVKAQLLERHGGSSDAQLLAVVTTDANGNGKQYRAANAKDLETASLAEKAIFDFHAMTSNGLPAIPNETCPPSGALGFRFQPYGIDHWKYLYTPRQLVSLTTFSNLVATFGTNATDLEDSDNGFKDAVQILLALAIGRMNDRCCTLCRWEPDYLKIQAANGAENKMPMRLDFVESNPFGGKSGDWMANIDWIAKVVEHIASIEATNSGTVAQSPARSCPLPNDIAVAFVTDPPYYDAFGYSDLSEFFYVWLRRAIPKVIFNDFANDKPDKKNEAIAIGKTLADDRGRKDKASYLEEMHASFVRAREATMPSGIGLVVFASKSTEAWEAILDALVNAGWVVTGSWPIDTEMAHRTRALGAAALHSSIHLLCRPREDPDGNVMQEVGEWRDVLAELPTRIHQWMPRLAAEGVVGADAIFACLGPALEIFSRYSRVEKANGEAVPLREYLEHVWAAVSTEALTMIFKDADAAGLEPDARLTAMWLWTLGAGTGKAGGNGQAVEVVPGMAADHDESPPADKLTASSGYTLEFDAARKIAQGLGIHLEQSERIVEVKGDKARLLPVGERTAHLFGKQQAITSGSRKRPKAKQQSLFEELDTLEAEAEAAPGELKPEGGATVLDRVHQAMILFASGRGEALRRFLVDDGAGKDARFWKLAQSLSALYPPGTDEKRWVDGVLARKKGLGL